MQEYKSIHGFEDEREHCLDIFRANAGDIFNLEIPPDDDFGEVVRRRYPVNIFLSSSGPGQVKVRCRSGGSGGSDLDLSYTLFLVFTHHPPPPPTTQTFFSF